MVGYLRENLASFFGIRLKMVGLIVSVGLSGGLFGACYLWLLDRVTAVMGPEHWGAQSHIVVLAGVGMVVSVLAHFLGHPAGVELLVDNIHVPGTTDDTVGPAKDRSGSLRSLLPISLLCVGAGGTLGPEAPLVTATGTLATRAAKKSGLDEGDVRTLAICGMAAGFSVLFGAPLGSAIFALEIPHRRGLEYYEAVMPAVMGATLGFFVSTAMGRYGLSPIWNFPAATEISSADLGWAVVAGVVGTLIALVFTGLVRVLNPLAGALPAHLRPIIGGLGLGAVALWSPYVLTNGEFQIQDLLGAEPVVSTLLLAGFLKLVGSAICVVTGWRGGFIIPLFFAGFVIGRALTEVLPIGNAWVFVVAVMVAANVGVTKTPIGSTLVVTEMSGMAVGPPAVIGALTAMVLTAPLNVIENQRRRFDAYESSPAPNVATQ